MLVYLATPIDQNDQRVNTTLSPLLGRLIHAGASVYTPADAFTVGPIFRSDMKAIDAINRTALRNADALVAWLPPGMPTLGVPSEIEQALTMNKPVMILTGPRLISSSVQMASWQGRGAATLIWSEGLSKSWYDNPQNLRELLTTTPADEVQLRAGRVPDHLSPTRTDLLVTLDPAAKGPSRAHADDAGLDLAIVEEVRLLPGEYKMVRTGVRAAVPEGWWGMITGRSSTWMRYRCDVRMAVIDAGYRGELMVGIENRGQNDVVFEAGVRLAQYVLIPTFPGSVVPVDRLSEAHRGEAGYGSSGA